MNSLSTKEQIDFSEFLLIEKKLDVRVGTIKSVERVEKSDKLLKLIVSFGDGITKTVVTNIGKSVNDINDMEGVQLPFIVNLKPVNMMGIESEAMILVGQYNDKIEYKCFTNGSKLI